MGTQGNPFAALPMLSLFGGIFGTLLLIAMAVDVYLLVKRQYSKPGHSRSRSAKAA